MKEEQLTQVQRNLTIKSSLGLGKGELITEVVVLARLVKEEQLTQVERNLTIMSSLGVCKGDLIREVVVLVRLW